MEEGVGFEPTVTLATLVFKTSALNRTLPTFRVGLFETYPGPHSTIRMTYLTPLGIFLPHHEQILVLTKIIVPSRLSMCDV